MSLCSFSSLDEIKCGCNGNISPNTNIVFSLCDSDITSHLQANHIPCSTIKTECDLIKARAGYYEENTNINNYVICPNHRFHLGKGWRRSRLCMAGAPLPNCSKKHKASTYNSISLLQSYEIWKQYKIVVPVGAGTYIYFFLFLYTVSILIVDP